MDYINSYMYVNIIYIQRTGIENKFTKNIICISILGIL